MLTAVLVVAGLLLLAALAYRVRCAISPFGRKGRRRLLYWRRSWWNGGQTVARDE